MAKYIITGGPGAGKTSLLNALQELGFNGSEEASRQLIIEEMAKQSDCLPWINLPAFAEKALARMIERYQAAPANAVTFFDRAIPDIIAYLKAGGLNVQDKYYKGLHSCPYQKQVFILPPWRDIYVNDTERWQSYEEAEMLYHFITKTYIELGFDLIELPPCSVEERAALVVEQAKLPCNLISG